MLADFLKIFFVSAGDIWSNTKVLLILFFFWPKSELDKNIGNRLTFRRKESGNFT